MQDRRVESPREGHFAALVGDLSAHIRHRDAVEQLQVAKATAEASANFYKGLAYMAEWAGQKQAKPAPKPVMTRDALAELARRTRSAIAADLRTGAVSKREAERRHLYVNALTNLGQMRITNVGAAPMQKGLADWSWMAPADLRSMVAMKAMTGQEDDDGDSADAKRKRAKPADAAEMAALKKMAADQDDADDQKVLEAGLRAKLHDSDVRKSNLANWAQFQGAEGEPMTKALSAPARSLADWGQFQPGDRRIA
jgi:hypothetical protein